MIRGSILFELVEDRMEDLSVSPSDFVDDLSDTSGLSSCTRVACSLRAMSIIGSSSSSTSSFVLDWPIVARCRSDERAARFESNAPSLATQAPLVPGDVGVKLESVESNCW